MRYVVVVNDEEIICNGDDMDLETARQEIGELLRSGYFEVESVEEVGEDDRYWNAH